MKLEDGGPVLYSQTRVGKDGADFELLKLRTMVVGAETMGAGYAVDEGDARITRVGRFLRRLSLDELPQLWNVIRGDMSVIGPRPTLAIRSSATTRASARRLEVKPGITGWAQVHGRAALPWAERIELDVWYVEHRSPARSTCRSSRRRRSRSSAGRTRARPAAGASLRTSDDPRAEMRGLRLRNDRSADRPARHAVLDDAYDAQPSCSTSRFAEAERLRAREQSLCGGGRAEAPELDGEARHRRGGVQPPLIAAGRPVTKSAKAPGRSVTFVSVGFRQLSQYCEPALAP